MKKYYIKKNIIGFIVGVILCTGTFVYAAVTFPSNQVTYDNTASGLSSTNVKGAIDELYTECTKEPPAGEQIIENAGLEKDEYECRYFFTGATPNNYITFNNEQAGWRIISVECDGTIKIIRTESIGRIVWDGTPNNGSNNWARPASLNTYLNGTYYNGLNATAQSQIVAKDWNIGFVSYGNSNMTNQINSENFTKWNGKVALVTMSEYIRSNSNKSSCGTFSLYNSNHSSCKNTTWMFYSNDYWWTLSPYSGGSTTVYYVDDRSNNGVYSNNVGYVSAVHPTLYLSSDVTLSGSGTQSDPYVVS